MNTAALRLATSRGVGWRRWPYGAHGNGNWLELFLWHDKAGISQGKLRYPTAANCLTGYHLPRLPEWNDRKKIKRKLRAWLKREAVYEGATP